MFVFNGANYEGIFSLPDKNHISTKEQMLSNQSFQVPVNKNIFEYVFCTQVSMLSFLMTSRASKVILPIPEKKPNRK